MGVEHHEMRDIVIRPSAVWDSRAPLITFIGHDRRLARIFSLLTLAVGRLHADAVVTPTDEVRPSFFRVRQGGYLADKAWQMYRRATPDHAWPAKLENVAKDLRQGLSFVTESVVISYVATFETFVQCWALNMLLAKLESNEPISVAERRLLKAFASAHFHVKRPVPGVPAIRQSIPELQVVGDTDAVIDDVAIRMWPFVEFWRDVRNLVVHSSGIVSGRFVRAHADILRSVLDSDSDSDPVLPQNMIGHRIRLRYDVFKSMRQAFDDAARNMDFQLQRISNDRRGCSSMVIGSGREQYFMDRPGLMISDVDHADSYRWTMDEQFRREVRAEIERPRGSAV